MTNEEKIRQIRVEKLHVFDGHGIWMDCADIDNILLEMAEWKDKQDESWLFEVKEVDLEKEIDNYFSNSVRKNLLANDNVTLFMQCRKVAKHFFELGIAVSNKTQKGE